MRNGTLTTLIFPTTIALALVACGDDAGERGSDSVGGTLSGTDTLSSTGAGSGSSTGVATSEGTGTSAGTSAGTTGGTGTSGTGTGGTSAGTGSSGGSTGAPCPMGDIVCEGDTAKVCDGNGGFSSETPCAPEVCADGLGCVACIPGEVQCNGDTVEVCDAMGTGFVPTETCDPLQGQTCDAGLGGCAGACSAAALGLSYIGCDYYPTVTQQNDGYNNAPQYEYAVAVANTSGMDADITITRGANMVAAVQVTSGSVSVVRLPWVNELTKGTGPSALVASGAYRLRSTQPVTVYQFNPVDATYTNDASLLLPVNAWGETYVVGAWPKWSSYPGFYAVTAEQDGTTVTLTPSATGGQVQAGGGVAADGTGQVMLNQGDVLQVMTSAGDLTGTRVVADKPVQVIGGHDCTDVPLNITACDHLEESIFPLDALAKEYFVAPPVHPSDANAEKAQIVRIIATEADTTLTFDPDQPVNKSLTNAGDYLEIGMSTAAYKVSADKKILVTQYMVGQSAGYGLSDPAMVQAVPAEQFRTDYLFYAATNWSSNYVDVIAPDGATVTVDGAMVPVGSWKSIGATGWSYAHVQLSNAGDGTHTVQGDQKVGIGVYGVQSFGSYWYPGGLDLTVIPQ